MKNTYLKVAIIVSAFFSLTMSSNVAMAENITSLGAINDFAIIANTTITNTGPSSITGNVGLTPGTSITGFQFATLNGTKNINNASSVAAKNNTITIYNNINEYQSSLTAPTLGGTTKTAGTYNSASGAFEITGTLTLDGQNNPNAIFVFKADSTLVTSNYSKIVLINGAQACNIFWRVGSSATIGVNSIFKGNLIVLTSTTVNTGANIEGRILVINGAVTLDNNSINKPSCSGNITIANENTEHATPEISSNTYANNYLLTRIRLLEIINLLQLRK